MSWKGGLKHIFKLRGQPSSERRGWLTSYLLTFFLISCFPHHPELKLSDRISGFGKFYYKNRQKLISFNFLYYLDGLNSVFIKGILPSGKNFVSIYIENNSTKLFFPETKEFWEGRLEELSENLFGCLMNEDELIQDMRGIRRVSIFKIKKYFIGTSFPKEMEYVKENIAIKIKIFNFKIQRLFPSFEFDYDMYTSIDIDRVIKILER
ncbi:MAG: hypothetical protein AB1410_03380 [Acidobacteriota bacterium]